MNDAGLPLTLIPMKGGRAGVSKASGFIQRLMAENKKKHEGEYKNPTYPLAPGSKMKAPAKFDWKALASKEQGGINESAYGASPFILSNFAGKPKMKETAKQRAARLAVRPRSSVQDVINEIDEVLAEPKPKKPVAPPPPPPKAPEAPKPKPKSLIAQMYDTFGSDPYLTHKKGSIWTVSNLDGSEAIGEFDIGLNPKDCRYDEVREYWYIPLEEGGVIDAKTSETIITADKLYLYFDQTPDGRGTGASEGVWAWSWSSNPPGGFTLEPDDNNLFADEEFMDKVWIPYQTRRGDLPEEYESPFTKAVGVEGKLWVAYG